MLGHSMIKAVAADNFRLYSCKTPSNEQITIFQRPYYFTDLCHNYITYGVAPGESRISTRIVKLHSRRPFLVKYKKQEKQHKKQNKLRTQCHWN